LGSASLKLATTPLKELPSVGVTVLADAARAASATLAVLFAVAEAPWSVMATVTE